MTAPESDAFSLRKPGTNPIALELERLAEQKALATLGAPHHTGIPSPETMDAYGGNAPSLTATTVSPEAPAELTPSMLASGSDMADAFMQFQDARTPQFDYDPADPRWGGLEEDQAYELWKQQMAGQPMGLTTADRDAFLRALGPR